MRRTKARVYPARTAPGNFAALSVSRQFVNITPGTEGKPPSARRSVGPMTLSLYDFVLIPQRTKLSLGTGWKSARFPPERLSA